MFPEMLLLKLASLWAVVLASDAPKHYVIFVGNPGVGKSTILNSMFQKHQFDSGINFGKGKTTLMKSVPLTINEHTFYFIDSPGLADAEIRVQAAKEIEDGLKQGGMYTIIFIVQQIQGRVIVQDATTMRLVMDALPSVPDNGFGVLVNQIPKKMMKRFNDESGKAVFLNSIWLNANRKTEHIRLVEVLDDLDAEDNAWFPQDSDQLTLIHSLMASVPPVHIKSDDVKQVHASDFDQVQEKMAEQLEELQKDAELARKEAASNQQRLEAMQRQHEADLRKIQHQKSQGGGSDLGSILGTIVTAALPLLGLLR